MWESQASILKHLHSAISTFSGYGMAAMRWMKNRPVYVAGLLCLMTITIVKAQNTQSTERPAETRQFGKVRFQASCLPEVETLY